MMIKLLTIEQLAELLQVKKSTIYSFVNKNKIPHVKLTGKLIRFKPSDIEEWIDGHKPQAPAKNHTQPQFGDTKRPLRSQLNKLFENAKSEVLSNN